MTHDEVGDLLGAYVLDVVSVDEQEAVETHLKTCPACRDEVALLRIVPDQLALLAEEREPPPELRIRLMNLVEHERAQWTQAQAAPTATVARPPLLRRLGRLPMRAYGVGGALLVAAVVLIVVVLTRGGGVSVLHTYTGGPVAQRVDGVAMGGASATVRIRSDHTTRVTFSDLPMLDPARAYELWFIPAKGSPVSLGGFRAGAGHTYGATYTKDAAAYALVAVTIERAPGDWPTPSKNLAIAVKVTG